MSQENINSKNVSSDSDEISLKEVFFKVKEWYEYLKSKWLLLLILVSIGGVFGYFYAMIKKPIFIATTTFVLEDGGSSTGMLGGLGGLASIAGLNLGSGGGIFQGDNILELYKSRKMIEKTLLTEIDFNGKKKLLIDRYISFNNLRSEWEKNAELKGIGFRNIETNGVVVGFSRQQDSIMGSIVDDIRKNYLKVEKPDKTLSLIKADVKSTDEFFAKTFNNQIVENVNDFYIQTKTKRSLDNVQILKQKSDSVLAVMNGAIYNAAAVADATPNLNPTRQTQRSVPIQRSQATIETNKQLLAELIKNLELSKITLRKESPLIQVVDEPVFPLEKVRIGKVKGMIIGGFLTGFLTVLFLTVRRLFKMIIA